MLWDRKCAIQNSTFGRAFEIPELIRIGLQIALWSDYKTLAHSRKHLNLQRTGEYINLAKARCNLPYKCWNSRSTFWGTAVSQFHETLKLSKAIRAPFLVTKHPKLKFKSGLLWLEISRESQWHRIGGPFRHVAITKQHLTDQQLYATCKKLKASRLKDLPMFTCRLSGYFY